MPTPRSKIVLAALLVLCARRAAAGPLDAAPVEDGAPRPLTPSVGPATAVPLVAPLTTTLAPSLSAPLAAPAPATALAAPSALPAAAVPSAAPSASAVAPSAATPFAAAEAAPAAAVPGAAPAEGAKEGGVSAASGATRARPSARGGPASAAAVSAAGGGAELFDGAAPGRPDDANPVPTATPRESAPARLQSPSVVKGLKYEVLLKLAARGRTASRAAVMAEIAGPDRDQFLTFLIQKLRQKRPAIYAAQILRTVQLPGAFQVALIPLLDQYATRALASNVLTAQRTLAPETWSALTRLLSVDSSFDAAFELLWSRRRYEDEVLPPDVERLLAGALGRESDHSVRAYLIKSKTLTGAFWKALRARLADKDTVDEALAVMGDRLDEGRSVPPALVEPVVEIALTGTAARVRRATAILRRFNRDGAIDADVQLGVLARLTTDPDEAVRANAADLLSDFDELAESVWKRAASDLRARRAAGGLLAWLKSRAERVRALHPAVLSELARIATGDEAEPAAEAAAALEAAVGRVPNDEEDQLLLLDYARRGEAQWGRVEKAIAAQEELHERAWSVIENGLDSPAEAPRFVRLLLFRGDRIYEGFPDPILARLARLAAGEDRDLADGALEALREISNRKSFPDDVQTALHRLRADLSNPLSARATAVLERQPELTSAIWEEESAALGREGPGAARSLGFLLDSTAERMPEPVLDALLRAVEAKDPGERRDLLRRLEKRLTFARLFALVYPSQAARQTELLAVLSGSPAVGFFDSSFGREDAVVEILDALELERSQSGADAYAKRVGYFRSMRDVSVQLLALPRRSEFKTTGRAPTYVLPYAVPGLETSETVVPAQFVKFKPGAAADPAIGKMFESFDAVIAANFRALGLLAHAETGMTRRNAELILDELGLMVDRLAELSDAGEELDAYRRVRAELETLWKDLPATARLPSDIARRMSQHEGRANRLNSLRNVHTLINVVHQRSFTALWSALGRVGGDGRLQMPNGHGEISLLNLGDELAHRGRPSNPLLGLLMQAKGSVSTSFNVIVKNEELWYHMPLGVHSAEVHVRYAEPDSGGIIQIRYNDSYDDHRGSNARLEYIRRSLARLGLRAKITGKYLEAVLDKDNGLTSKAEIADVFPKVLTLLLNTHNYDLSFNSLKRSSRAKLLDEMPEAFLAEGLIPVEDSSLEEGMAAWREGRARREALRAPLDAELRRLKLPPIPADAAMGQETIETFFTRPVKLALASGELALGPSGAPERAGGSPTAELARAAATDAGAARVGDAVRAIDPAELDFAVVGSVGRLRAERAQRESSDGLVLTVFALRDPRTEAVAFATARLWDGRGGVPLDADGLVRALARDGVAVSELTPAAAAQSASWRRLLHGRAEAVGENRARGVAAARGAGPVYASVVFDKSRAGKGGALFVPFTAPDDIEVMRRSAAVVTTGGGLLSHAAITTRELGMASVILSRARWRTGADGRVSLEAPVESETDQRRTPEGLYVADAGAQRHAVAHEGDLVAIDGARGTVAFLGKGDPAVFASLREGLRAADAASLASRFARKLKSELSRQSPAARAALVRMIIDEALDGPRFRTNIRLQESALKALAASLDPRDLADERARLGAWLESELESIELELGEPGPSLPELATRLEGLTSLSIAFSLPANEIREARFDVSRLASLANRRAAERLDAAMKQVQKLAPRASALTEADLPALRRLLREVWPGRARAQRRRLLFVCTGNTCRSPIAEYLTKARLARAGLDGLEVESRGIGVGAADFAPLGITPEASRTLAGRGIDASAHAARGLTAEDVARADLILPMQRGQTELIASFFSNAADKVVTLKAYAGQGDADVSDPMVADAGLPRDAVPGPERAARRHATYEETTREIDAALAPVVARESALRALDRREQELTRAKRERLEKSAPSVLPFAAIDDDYVPWTGGKAAKLGEIMRVVDGLGEVPDGAALTTEAYFRFLKQEGIDREVAAEAAAIDNYLARADLDAPATQEWVRARSEKIQALIRSKALSAESPLGREIMAALAAHGLAEGSFAVRSSAVQEDGAEAAFAGAADTALFVPHGEILQKVVDGWASFWLPRGIIYRKQHGITSQELRPAIAVQRMVDSAAAGVLFTVNPATGRRETVINAAYGQGEGVVSGLVNADQYVADEDGAETQAPRLGDKRVRVDKRADGRGTEVRDVAPGLRRRRALTADQVGRLARIGAALERHFGYPVDVEFAVENDRIAVLQVRPVTTAPRS